MARKPNVTTSVSAFGTLGRAVAPDDNNDLTEQVAKAVQVVDVSGGSDLQVLPYGNADGQWITYVGVQVGFTPLFQVRRVGEATTCACVAISG